MKKHRPQRKPPLNEPTVVDFDRMSALEVCSMCRGEGWNKMSIRGVLGVQYTTDKGTFGVDTVPDSVIGVSVLCRTCAGHGTIER